MVNCEVSTEGSKTAKVSTDEQEVHKRLLKGDERTQQREVQSEQKNLLLVDVPGINRKKKLLPGEVLAVTS